MENKKEKNAFHQRKYKKVIDPLYKDLYEKMNEYVLSYKTNEDRLAADFHCIFNLAVFCFARLRQMAQQSGNEAFVYNDALRRIIDKGLKMGNDEIILNGKY